MSFGEVIRKSRKKKSLTQLELAEKLGITRNYLSDLENNRYNPSFATAIKIAEVLDIDINFLKQNDGNTSKKKGEEKDERN